jgi:serine/threonine protein kinase
LSTICGTAAYVAPEVLDLRAKGYDERADMWSIGVVVYILLGGYAHSKGQSMNLLCTILKGDYGFHDEYWSHISSEAKDLIASLLQVNPEKRSSAEEALQSNWMTAEEETLIVNDLSIAQKQIRKALPVEKLRGAVKAIIATNKITWLGETFTGSLVEVQALNEVFMGKYLKCRSLGRRRKICMVLVRSKDRLAGSHSLNYMTWAVHWVVATSLQYTMRNIEQSEIEHAVKCIGRRVLASQ